MTDEDRKLTDQPPPFPELPDVPVEETEPSAPSLGDNTGFDADAAIEKIKQQQPAMGSFAQKDQAQRRVAARGEQRAKQRKQRLGILSPDPLPPIAPVDIVEQPPGQQQVPQRQPSQQPPRPIVGPMVDYEGPYEGQQQPTAPAAAVQQQPPPQPNMSGDNVLLAELQKQTEFLKTIATKIETLGTYGA